MTSCMPFLDKVMVRGGATLARHYLFLSRVSIHTTSDVPAGTIIPLASPEEIAVTRPDRIVVTKSDHAAKRKASPGPEISTNTAKRTRLSQKLSRAGSSGLAAGDGVKQTDDGILDDDGQCDGLEFSIEDNGNLNDVNQGEHINVIPLRTFDPSLGLDVTKKFVSSRFSMIDIGEADVILGIKIKCKNKGIIITQSHYIEKILKKFNREDCSPVSTPMDPVEKLKPNTGKLMDQLEYSRAIGCLIYPSVLEAYSDASWINHVEDSSSTSRWVFLLRGGAISWASKKKTCITGSTMEYEFVALAAAGKEEEWLRNLIHKIPIWLKLIAPISIRCDSAPIMARAYSQIYNGKSRHLGVRHNMVRELIRNGARTKRTTYVNMKFSHFKKLGLGFLYVH
ncbi:zinc finger, CCHC-type containing protein [Tanacetum coccineum]